MRDPIFLNETDPASGEAQEQEQEQTWTGPSAEEWQETQQLIRAQQEWIAQQAAASQEQQTIDPYEDIDGYLEQKFEQKLAPYQGFQQEVVLREAEERAMDILSDIAKSGPEFDLQDARIRADHLLGEMQQRYGFGQKAAEAALQEAARQQIEKERAYGEAYHQRKINELQGLRGVPREPAPSGTAAAAEVVTPEGGDELDLVRSYFPTAR